LASTLLYWRYLLVHIVVNLWWSPVRWFRHIGLTVYRRVAFIDIHLLIGAEWWLFCLTDNVVTVLYCIVIGDVIVFIVVGICWLLFDSYYIVVVIVIVIVDVIVSGDCSQCWYLVTWYWMILMWYCCYPTLPMLTLSHWRVWNIDNCQCWRCWRYDTGGQNRPWWPGDVPDAGGPFHRWRHWR